MDFAALERLKEAAEAIHFPAADDHSGLSADERKAGKRREFALLMRSIRSMVRGDAQN